jgi:hypothetical protein
MLSVTHNKGIEWWRRTSRRRPPAGRTDAGAAGGGGLLALLLGDLVGVGGDLGEPQPGEQRLHGTTASVSISWMDRHRQCGAPPHKNSLFIQQ